MEVKCGFCCKKLNLEKLSIDNNLTADKNKEYYDTACELFGGKKLNLSTACIKCISALKTCHTFKQTVQQHHAELKDIVDESEKTDEKFPEIKASVDKFLSSDEEFLAQNFDGMLLIVPASKRTKIASLKYMTSLFSPRVSLRKLDIKFHDSDDDSENEPPMTVIPRDILSENSLLSLINGHDESYQNLMELVNEFPQDTTLPIPGNENSLHSLMNMSPAPNETIRTPAPMDTTLDLLEPMLSQVFSSDIPMETYPMETDGSECEMDVTCNSFADKTFDLPQIKLEPNIEISENDSSKEISQEPTEVDKEWIDKQIGRKNLKDKNGKFSFFCKICKKNFSSRFGASRHVQSTHFGSRLKIKIVNSRSLLNSMLTTEENQFVKENVSKKGKRGKCKICNLSFKRFDHCKQHVIVKHLKKSLSEFNYEAMKMKLCKKGRLDKKTFQCVICKDNDNPMIFTSRIKHIKHLRLHTKDDLKAYANEENAKIPSLDDETFDHPAMSMQIC